MKFGIFYELQRPRPWGPDGEENLVREALEQIELADRLGFDSVWEVEHHFLEEYSHSRKWCSTSQTESKPKRSASSICSRASRTRFSSPSGPHGRGLCNS